MMVRMINFSMFWGEGERRIRTSAREEEEEEEKLNRDDRCD